MVAAEEPPSVLIASSVDSGVNAGAVLKQVLAENGGRGGGSATLAQGKVPDGATIAALERRARLRRHLAKRRSCEARRSALICRHAT